MDHWSPVHNNFRDLQQGDGIRMANKSAFVDPSPQFGQAGLTDGNIMIDPMLQSMAPADPSIYSTISGSVADERYMTNNSLPNPGHMAMYNGGELYLSMPGVGNGDIEYREPSDLATSSNLTSHTRSISPSSDGHYRKASAASSRSSAPSLATLPEKKPRTVKQRNTRQTKQPAAPEPKRQSKQKDTVLKQEPVDDFGPQDDAKRNRFLERNRIAASKCRKKKKEWVNDLEETKQDLETQNANLHSEYNGLVNELSRIKTELMNHATCNDANIDSWLDLEARKFVQKAAKRQLETQTVGMQPRHPRAYSDAGSSINISPTTTTIPLPLSPKSQDNTDFNYDHMPDDMFDQ